MTKGPPSAEAPLLERAQARLAAAEFAPGSVWLVGAGPGDPGLLTLHAAHALAKADVVLHDALVPRAILELAATERLEPVGKRAGQKGANQLRINQRMIVLAREGFRVLRLKAGDPLIFGRGGEEALALAVAGIPFRIVPGISAGIGGTAAFGIPLTHRGLARSVAFATGHDSGGGPPAECDLARLARGAEVLVFYMGLGQASPIAAALMAAGRPAEEQVAILSDATRPEQRAVLTTLGGLPSVAAVLSRTAPSLIVVGPVVAFHELFASLLATTPMRALPVPAAAFPAALTA